MINLKQSKNTRYKHILTIYTVLKLSSLMPRNILENSVRFVKQAVGVERSRRRGREMWGGSVSLPRTFFIFFHFKTVHSGAFS